MKIFGKIILSLFLLMVIALPVLSFAQSSASTAGQGASSAKVCGQTINDIGDILCKVGTLLRSIIPVLVLLGVAYFVWGVVSFVISDDEEAKTKGRDRMIYGIIGLVVIVAMWGLVLIVINTFGLDTGTPQLVSDLIQKNSTVTTSNLGLCDLTQNPKIGNLLNYLTCLINQSVIPLIVALSIAMFIWGVVQYVINDDGEAKKEKGKQFMIWGLIGLIVIVGVWGLVRIVGDTFGINYAIPQLAK